MYLYFFIIVLHYWTACNWIELNELICEWILQKWYYMKKKMNWEYSQMRIQMLHNFLYTVLLDIFSCEQRYYNTSAVVCSLWGTFDI